MFDVYDMPANYELHDPAALAADYQSWAKHGNASLLFEQALFLLANGIHHYCSNKPPLPLVIWCGEDGAGYRLTEYLHRFGYRLLVLLPNTAMPANDDQPPQQDKMDCWIYADKPAHLPAAIHIDAMMGLGSLMTSTKNAPANVLQQMMIADFNGQQGTKIALNCPSGLDSKTGIPCSVAARADVTLVLAGLAIGLVLGQGRSHAGKLVLIPFLPNLDVPLATFDTRKPHLTQPLPHVHKGTQGTVLVIGGSRTMGGAVLLAGEAALACGAGKVLLFCDTSVHSAILARNPALMPYAFADFHREILLQADSVAFGMGLGRDELAKQRFLNILPQLLARPLKRLVLDADALYFLAQFADTFTPLPDWVVATPHDGEAGRLLGCAADVVAGDKVAAITKLQQRFAGQWVLKGAGTLVLQWGKLSVCPFANAAMATAGMGDVLSGVLAGLSAAQHEIKLSACVTVHALAGDEAAATAQTGATTMPAALKRLVQSLAR